MLTKYQVDTVDRVQRVLRKDQTIKIHDVTEDDYARVTPEDLPDFPDKEVTNGTRCYQRFQDGRIFEICILRGF